MFQKMFWNETRAGCWWSELDGLPPIPRRRAKKTPLVLPAGFSVRPSFIAIVSLLLHYRFAQTIVTRSVVEFGLLPQRAPFA